MPDAATAGPATNVDRQIALVTGGAVRLGRQICWALAATGADVVIHFGTSAPEAESLRSELSAAGVHAWTLQADLSDEAQCVDLVPRAADVAGGLSVLVNNASAFPPGRLAQATVEELQASLQVNAWAPLLVARAFVALPTARHVVNILDSNIASSTPGHMPYLLSKQVLGLLTRQMALEWAPRVSVNAVAPGLILPPDGAPEGALSRMAATTPMARLGDPQDVADAVAYLVSSRFVTGQVIFVDGGWHLAQRSWLS